MPFMAGSIAAKLTLDRKQFSGAITAVKGELAKTGSFIQKNSEQFKKWGRTTAIAGAAVLGSLGLMIKKASDSQETFAKFGTVFESVFGRAEESAKNLAKNYGLSALASKDMLAATGDLLTGLGITSDKALDLSERTQQLSVDLASFTNFSGGAKGASEALTKAMLGERESVKSLGIVITEEMVKEELLSQGKKDLTGQALLQAKAEATLTIAISQSKNAIGDYARTSDSLANKMREMKARLEDTAVEIGSKLIPIVTQLATKITGVITKTSDWMKENPKGAHIVNVASLAAVMCSPAMAAYNVTKAGMVALAETLYAELLTSSVGVTVVCPGFVKTNILERARYRSDDQREFAADSMRVSRLSAEQVADRLMLAIQRRELYLFLPTSTQRQWWYKRIAPRRYLVHVARGFRKLFGGEQKAISSESTVSSPSSS